MLFCRGNNSGIIILQKLDCMRAGLKKKAGGRGGAQPFGGGLGGWSPPHLQTYSLSRQEKALKRDCGV